MAQSNERAQTEGSKSTLPVSSHTHTANTTQSLERYSWGTHGIRGKRHIHESAGATTRVKQTATNTLSARILRAGEEVFHCAFYIAAFGCKCSLHVLARKAHAGQLLDLGVICVRLGHCVALCPEPRGRRPCGIICLVLLRYLCVLGVVRLWRGKQRLQGHQRRLRRFAETTSRVSAPSKSLDT